MDYPTLTAILGSSIFGPALGAAVVLGIVGFLAGLAGGRLIWSADRSRARELEEGIALLKEEIEKLEDGRKGGPPPVKRNWR